MIERISLRSADDPLLELHSIDEKDLENLRIWKNDHRESFFYQKTITSEEQTKWFEGYQSRTHDFMFVIVVAGQSIGCIGFRLLEERIDIYNVMLGNKECSGKGYMSRALNLMLSEATRRFPNIPLTLKVLKSNATAIHWYKKNGFVITNEQEGYFDMVLTT